MSNRVHEAWHLNPPSFLGMLCSLACKRITAKGETRKRFDSSRVNVTSRRPQRGCLGDFMVGCPFTVPLFLASDVLHSAKGGAVETGCSGLHYVIGCFII